MHFGVETRFEMVHSLVGRRYVTQEYLNLVVLLQYAMSRVDGLRFKLI